MDELHKLLNSLVTLKFIFVYFPDFENFKNSDHIEDMEVEMNHPNSCLWYDYFTKKIYNICSRAKIVRKKIRKNTK